MQWAAVHCSDMPGDGGTFEDPQVRATFVKAALIAAELWAERVYREESDIDAPIGENRRKFLPAIRCATDGGSMGINPMLAIGAAGSSFSAPLRLRPDMDEQFRRASGLSLGTFYGLLSIIAIYFLLRTPSEGGADEPATGLFHEKFFHEIRQELGDAFPSVFQCSHPRRLTSWRLACGAALPMAATWLAIGKGYPSSGAGRFLEQMMAVVS